MFDSRHHFRWIAAEETSWLDRLEALRLTPSARDIRARTPHVKISRHADREGEDSHALPEGIRLMRALRMPLDPLGYDD